MEREKKKAKITQQTDEKNPQVDMENAGEATDKVEELRTELEKANQQAAENFDGWQRERADFLNYKKRVERDKISTEQAITSEIVKKFLVILDDLERALKARPASGDGAAWAEGIELIYRKLQSLLESRGVTRIPAEDQDFDPNLHEAITHEDSPDFESGQIIEIIEQGYLLGDRVVRPARVRVAR